MNIMDNYEDYKFGLTRGPAESWRKDHAAFKFRLGQLEGAIKGVILHLEASQRYCAGTEWATKQAQVITNLKTLLGESQ